MAVPGRAMIPAAEPERRHALRVTTLVLGMAEKGVSLFYEKRLHIQISEVWAARCQMQLLGALQALARGAAGRTTPFWFGERLQHADVAVAAAFRFISEAHPGLIAPESAPNIAAFCHRLEALAVFRQISQPFISPA
jgi:glutathione S-transferase